MNLAALWSLPVLFLYENNLYAMGTAIGRSQAQQDMELRARSYGIPSEAVDGMDVLAVEEAATRIAEAVRSGGGPRLLELRTYRFRAHSMADPELYRAKEEVESWMRRDPIALCDARLRELGLLDDASLAELEEAVAAELEDAIAFAEESPPEPAEVLERDVYTEALP
jgi:pyruvate dehydrogenase E1 component alpha subunit